MRSNTRGRRQAGGSTTANLLKGAAAGALGVWVMDRVDWFMYEREGASARRQTRRARPEGKAPADVLAGRAARLVGQELPDQHPAGVAVHYAIGMAPAALYGAYRDQFAPMGGMRGLLYGLGLFVVEDEVMNPALGLAGGPGRYPLSTHGRGLVAHLVYGVVTELVLDVIDGRTKPAPLRLDVPGPRERLELEAVQVQNRLKADAAAAEADADGPKNTRRDNDYR